MLGFVVLLLTAGLMMIGLAAAPALVLVSVSVVILAFGGLLVAGTVLVSLIISIRDGG